LTGILAISDRANVAPEALGATPFAERRPRNLRALCRFAAAEPRVVDVWRSKHCPALRKRPCQIWILRLAPARQISGRSRLQRIFAITDP